MKTLSYKGYQGSIEYEDGQLIIQLLHIDDFITATCDSASQAEAIFHELVDDYLVTCEESGRPADKPYKGSLNIRMTPEHHRGAAMAATSAGISLNAWIVRACEAFMSRDHKNMQDSRINVSKPPQPVEIHWDSVYRDLEEHLNKYWFVHSTGEVFEPGSVHLKTVCSFSPRTHDVWTDIKHYDPFEQYSPKLEPSRPIRARLRDR